MSRIDRAAPTAEAPIVPPLRHRADAIRDNQVPAALRHLSFRLMPPHPMVRTFCRYGVQPPQRYFGFDNCALFVFKCLFHQKLRSFGFLPPTCATQRAPLNNGQRAPGENVETAQGLQIARRHSLPTPSHAV